MMNPYLVPDWKVNFLKKGCQAIRLGARSCIDLLRRECKNVQIIDKEISVAVQTITAEEVYIIRQLIENYPKITEHQLKLIKEDKRQTYDQRRKGLLLEAESGFIDYGIEEMEEQRKVQTEQMSIDIEVYKENVSKVSMDLDSNINQDKDNEADPPQEANMDYINKNQDISTLSESHKRRKNEETKSSMELDINSDQDETKSEEKLDQRTENITNMEMNLSQLNSSLNRTRERVRKNLTLWDIPNGTPARQIRKNLSYYGRVTVKGFMANGKSKAAYVEIEFKNEKRRADLENAWAVHFELGKMVRITQGHYDAESLVERSKHKLILKNVPKAAIETTLLRQLRCINTKAVYISTNRNGNQRGTASIYFANEQDCSSALGKTVYYYHTKLDWVSRSNLEPRIEQDAGKGKILTGPNAITINRERRFGKPKENFQVNKEKSMKNHGEYVEKRKIETGNNENHKLTYSTQEQLQVNTILYEILNRLELIENRQAASRAQECPTRS